MKHTVKSVFSLLLVLCMLCGMIVLPTSAAEGSDSAQFVVLSTTDMHGRCWDANILNDTSMTNSMLNVSTAVKQLRATYGENVVLIDNGDTYQGTPVSSLQITQYTQGLTTDPNPMAISMKYIGYDASGLGNHEFNYAWSTMSATYDYLMAEEEGLRSLPALCANLYYDGTDGVHAAGENVMTPYITKNLKDSKGQDVKVAILAFDTPDCTRWDIPDNYPAMRFSHPDNPNLSLAWEAEKWLAVIEEKEAPDFVIVSVHSGLGSYTTAEDLVYGSNTEDQVLSMIRDTSGIDMVIAGHDHSESYSNNTYKNEKNEDVLVVNGGGNSLTTSVFTIDADGTIRLESSVNNKLSNYAADTTLKAMLKKYADAASEYVNATAGVAVGTWDHETNFYLKQSDTIDLIGRAQIAQGSVHLAEKYNTEEKLAELYEATGLDHITVDVSSTSIVVNGSYTVRAGNLSMKDIYRMYRYDNSLYLIPVTGREIKDILEFNAATHLSVSTASGTPIFGTKGDNFTNPVFYGLDFRYDMSREEYDRVTGLKFADGREVIEDQVYIIAINNYHLGNASGPFAEYTTEDAIWSQTDDMGGGFVQDLISEYLAAQTEKNGGVSPEPSDWALVYNAEVVIGEAEGAYIGSLVDPNTLETGDRVLIYYPASNTFISNVASGSRLAPSEDVSTGEADGVSQAGTDDITAVFTVEKHADGSVSFLDADGKYMTSGASGNAMSMEEALSDCARWTFVATDNGWYVHNEGANYMGNYNQYLEYYYGFTTYGLGAGGALYTFNFYKLGESTVPTITTQIAATSKNMTKYGHLDLDISADAFLETFALGDIVTVTFTVDGTERSYDFPVCSNYDDVDTYAYLIRAVSGKDVVTMAINYGKIGVEAGVIEPSDDGGYQVKEGVTLPIEATVTLKEAGGYAKELEIRALNRTNNREDYPNLTDREFANFRLITTTGMGSGILYRSSSPINPELGRNTYAVKAAADAGVKTFVNLADSEAEATAYEGYADSYYSAQNHIFLGLPVAFESEEFKSGLAEGFRYIASNEGPYLVHCTEGKDRAGLTAAILECLMGATVEEICADYVKTFRNYYNVVDGVQTDLTDDQVAYLENAILNNLTLIFGMEDAKTADLAAEAAEYMAVIGLTESEIAQLKANLSVDVEDSSVTLEIFETTDIHGYLLDTSSGSEATFQYRMAYIANVINEARADAENDDVILLDGGDIYQGTPVSNLTFGNALRAAMDYMGYDAVSLGNHEFDWDVITYAADRDGTMPAYEIGDFKGDSDIPVLAYNLIDNATGKKADFVREYTILDKGGLKVAVIGYIPDYSMDIMAAKINPYTIDEGLEGLSDKIDEMIQAEAPDVVIVLAHASPKHIAEALDSEKVDLVLGGHSHQPAYGVADSGVAYLQGNCQAQGYANAKLIVDTVTGEVTVENPTYVKITGDKAALYDTEENAEHLDSDILAISKASWDAVKDTMQEVLGEVDQSIYRRQYIGDSTNTIAGNWLTGIMLRATAEQNTMIAFTNSGGIRCDLLKDEDAETRAITVGDIYTISPFCNRWYIYDLTGAELAQTVNNAFTNPNYGDQFSGMVVTYTETEGEPGPEGMPPRPVRTVVSITLDDGTPVDITDNTNRIYRIVTNEYCATLPGAVTEKMTPVVDINEAPIDNEAIIAVLRAEGKANDGKLALDLTERCVKEPTFTDVARGEWYFTYVEAAVKAGLVNGYTDGSFRPEGTLTRAEAATLLYRMAGTPEVSATASFTDLPNEWYREAIAWAEATGVVTGFPDGTFRPDESVTREQFVTMLWRLEGKPEAASELEGFVDIGSVSAYAQTAFAWAVENGIVNGITSYQWEGVRLAPQDNIKRCEAAKIFVVCMEK